ncbi:MAG: DUF2953 domain-containing protein [Ruminococcus sp.]|nr:DUF2953 domain-containing protein [Ruminococcus sp.]
MRIFLIILLVLLLILAIIMVSRIVLAVEFWNGEFRYAVRYFGIQVYPFKKEKEPDPEEEERKAEEKARKKEEKEAERKAQKEAEKAERKKRLLAEKIQCALQKIAERSDLIGDILSAIPGPLQKLLRSVTLGNLETDFLIGGEDAADTALLYGKIQIAVQNVLAFLGKYIHVKRKKVRIACDFTADESRWNIRCKVKVRIGTAVAAALWFLWKYWRAGKNADKTIVDPRI